jgi:hypothetical protein
LRPAGCADVALERYGQVYALEAVEEQLEGGSIRREISYSMNDVFFLFGFGSLRYLRDRRRGVRIGFTKRATKT